MLLAEAQIGEASSKCASLHAVCLCACKVVNDFQMNVMQHMAQGAVMGRKQPLVAQGS